MINKTQFSKLRTVELLQMATDVVSICNKKQPDQLQIAAQVEALRNATDALDACYKTDQASALSLQVSDLDMRRDKYLTGIRQLANSFTYHFDQSLALAGSSITASIDKYGNRISLMNYQAETSTINSILNSWKNDSKLASAIELLNLSTWTNELKSVNDQFNQVYLSRVEETAQKPALSSFEARRQCSGALRLLTKHIEARAIIDNGGLYNVLIAELNTLVNKYNTIADSHITKPESTEAARNK